MKVIIIFYVCVSLYLSEIQGTKRFQDILDKINEVINTNATINGIFKPSERGYLDEGFYGVLFKGTLVTLKKDVAMKFTPAAYEYCAVAAENEYKMYSYLNAINNSAIEMYGVPSVYYYGRWQSYILMAITLLDSPLKISDEINELDVLIIFREFVRISKYIHSRGIFHSDIKLKNMMFRRNQGFIIDYNTSEKMTRSAKKDGRKNAKNDWECFFYVMCAFIRMRVNYDLGLKNIMKKVEEIQSDALRRVFVEFAKNIYNIQDSLNYKGKHISLPVTILHYDRLYQIINEEIENINPSKPARVSWLKDEDKAKAIQEMKKIPKISNIDDPFGTAEPQYSEVNSDYFYKHPKRTSEIRESSSSSSTLERYST